MAWKQIKAFASSRRGPCSLQRSGFYSFQVCARASCIVPSLGCQGVLDRLRRLTGHDGTAVGTPSQRMSINGTALSPRPRSTVRSGELDLGMSVRSGQDRRPSHSGMGISIGQTTLSGIDMSLTNSDGSTTAIVCAAESQTRSNSLVLHSLRSLFAAQVLQ
ncbi:hypothetical protein CC79DRAFT_187182 [Sarocladium strictum]|jgi:hypothetical protein